MKATVTAPVAHVRIKDEEDVLHEAPYARGQVVEVDDKELKRVNRGDWKTLSFPHLVPTDKLDSGIERALRERLDAELEDEVELDDDEAGSTGVAPDSDPDFPESSRQQATAALAAEGEVPVEGVVSQARTRARKPASDGPAEA